MICPAYHQGPPTGTLFPTETLIIIYGTMNSSFFPNHFLPFPAQENVVHSW
jgi:hypothetical protein